MTQPDAVETLAAALIADFEALQTAITAELRALATELPTLSRTARVARLRRLQANIQALTTDADAIAARTVLATTQNIYELGAWTTALTASVTPSFQTVDVDAVTALAQDLMADLLHATRGVTNDVKALIRDLTRHQVMTKVYTGQTAMQAARDLTKELVDRGIASVIYSNGRRVPINQYAEMVIRTRTAETYQAGGLNQGERLGIQWWEVMDGPGCGLTGHGVGEDANGMIIPLELARKWPLGHPNCRRSSSPRPDITTASQARHASPVGDMTPVWEAATAAQARNWHKPVLSPTPAAAKGLDLTAGTLPPTPTGARFAARVRKHTA